MKATLAFAFFLLFLAGIALSNLGRLQTQQAVELRAPLAAELVSTRWRLAALRGALQAEAAGIELTFTRGGLLSVTGACNIFSADYELEDTALAVHGVTGTRRACETAAMDFDDAFVATLERTAAAGTDGRQLVLLSADGERLARLSAAAPEPARR